MYIGLVYSWQRPGFDAGTSTNKILLDLMSLKYWVTLLAILIFAMGTRNVRQQLQIIQVREHVSAIELQVTHVLDLYAQEKTINDSLAVELERYHPETVWLARGIYSETNLPHEMRYVAWVIRNRVELKFNGMTTYRDVVLDKWQFSAFNGDNPRRWYYINKSVTDGNDPWLEALHIAHEVRVADSTERPIPLLTTHFYSEISMIPAWRVPSWAKTMEQYQVPNVEEKRFRFYSSDSLSENITLN